MKYESQIGLFTFDVLSLNIIPLVQFMRFLILLW